jgi:hypothetical protein
MTKGNIPVASCAFGRRHYPGKTLPDTFVTIGNVAVHTRCTATIYRYPATLPKSFCLSINEGCYFVNGNILRSVSDVDSVLLASEAYSILVDDLDGTFQLVEYGTDSQAEWVLL